MKNCLLMIILLCQTAISSSQTVYFGYPPSNSTLNKGDAIVLNIPTHRDGRFESPNSFDNLVFLINKYPYIVFRVEINFYYGSPDYSEEYSKHLARDLKKILNKKCNESNFYVISMGIKKPLLCINDDSKLFKSFNTRIEIFTE